MMEAVTLFIFFFISKTEQHMWSVLQDFPEYQEVFS